jgi:hypothetical protein
MDESRQERTSSGDNMYRVFLLVFGLTSRLQDDGAGLSSRFLKEVERITRLPFHHSQRIR